MSKICSQVTWSPSLSMFIPMPWKAVRLQLKRRTEDFVSNMFNNLALQPDEKTLHRFYKFYFVVILPHFNCSGDLKFRCVWILKGWKEVGFTSGLDLKWVWNPPAQPFEIWTNGFIILSNKQISRFSFQMVGTIFLFLAQPYKNRTIWNLVSKKSSF